MRGRSRSPDTAAYGLLRQAYEAEYRYGGGFGGFEADVYYSWDKEGWGGRLRFRSPSSISYRGEVRHADEQFRWEVASMVAQRWGRPFEEAEGSLSVALDCREDLRGSIVCVEDGLSSRYGIRAGEICQIERRFGDLRFVITIQERTFTDDGRTLPLHFCAVYWSEANGRVVRTDIYRDCHAKVGGVYLPLSRRVTTADDSGLTERRILFRDHRLLGTGACRAG